MATTEPRRPRLGRLGWFVLLYLVGAGATLTVAYGLRALLFL